MLIRYHFGSILAISRCELSHYSFIAFCIFFSWSKHSCFFISLFEVIWFAFSALVFHQTNSAFGLSVTIFLLCIWSLEFMAFDYLILFIFYWWWWRISSFSVFLSLGWIKVLLRGSICYSHFVRSYFATFYRVWSLSGLWVIN